MSEFEVSPGVRQFGLGGRGRYEADGAIAPRVRVNGRVWAITAITVYPDAAFVYGRRVRQRDGEPFGGSLPIQPITEVESL